MEERRENPASLIVKTQHSLGYVSIQPNNIMMQIDGIGGGGGMGSSESAHRHLFSPPNMLYNNASQNSGSGNRMNYFESSNPSIKLVDNMLLQGESQGGLNSAGGIGPLSLRS